MINVNNIKDVLKALDFEKRGIFDVYSRQYRGAELYVDFDHDKIVYPEGLTVHDQTTSNFSHNENFVVFECVCRLLEKGYRPEHMELEPRWVVGHSASGGKADILVRDENGDSYIIIECKTPGTEYSKEKKSTETNGGQLFSYWQQVTSTKWLALYASDWDGDNITYTSHVVHSEDDANILKLAENDKDVLTYQKANNNVERFRVWDETYNKAWLDNVIFDEESTAYNVGVPPLRKSKLKDFANAQSIVNAFEEILRHNNVSDKENAFNRLVALFICKLVDEIKKQDYEVVDFQYKQGTDTYETLQDRLQRLHKQGMDEFMREKIFYVEADYADKLFQQYTGRRRKEAIKELNETIWKLKFYTNNDFAFKDVHNEELFYQNGKILVEMVQLFQPYRIVFSSKNQVLGDLFEGLLNKGFKQNEGQFFTPIPITRFIWHALPLADYISNNGIPRVIDYACGAGHFLTEAVEAINSVQTCKDNMWAGTHIYGVEKDYRLARVSKISMFMNGAGDANIIFGDGLENYPEKGIKPQSFDILVANPPYSVKGFKQHLKLKNNSFELMEAISNDSDDIELLFVERIAQLVKPQGLAAVILPPSIRTSDNVFISAREQILKEFSIRAIVEFGNKTFGATTTNTNVFFLQRYDEPPRIANLVNDSVEAIMRGDALEDFIDGELLAEYLTHQGIGNEQYTKFLRRQAEMDELKESDYLRVYVEAFSKKKIEYRKRSTPEERESMRKEKFYDYALATEKEKLYYFALVRKQHTTVIKAPLGTTKEQVEIQGYDWRGRKGSEGIKIISPGGMLYDENDRHKRGTLACVVRNSYIDGVTTEIDENLQKCVNTYMLKDMIDFSKETFHKEINLTGKAIPVESKYHLRKISDIIHPIKGDATKVPLEEIMPEGDTPVITQERGILISGYTNTSKPITDLPLILFGDHSCTFKFVDFYFVRGADGTQLLKTDEKEVYNKYLFYYLSSITIINEHKYERHMKYLQDVQVPVPPLSVQMEIIKECEAIDEEYNNSRTSIEENKSKISDIFTELEVKTEGKGCKLNALCQYVTERIPFTEISVADYVSTDNLLQNCEGVKEYEETPNISLVVRFRKYDILLSNIRPYLQKIWLADRDGGCNNDVLALRVVDNNFMPEYVYHCLARKPFFDYVMQNVKGMKMPRGNKDHILRYTIPNVSIEKQQDVLRQLHNYAELIADAKAVMDTCTSRINAVLDKYLK